MLALSEMKNWALAFCCAVGSITAPLAPNALTFRVPGAELLRMLLHTVDYRSLAVLPYIP